MTFFIKNKTNKFWVRASSGRLLVSPKIICLPVFSIRFLKNVFFTMDDLLFYSKETFQARNQDRDSSVLPKRCGYGMVTIHACSHSNIERQTAVHKLNSIFISKTNCKT